jgi:hypothetical protein
MFTMENRAASRGMMQSKTSSRFALDATQSCIEELIEGCCLMRLGNMSAISMRSRKSWYTEDTGVSARI